MTTSQTSRVRPRSRGPGRPAPRTTCRCRRHPGRPRTACRRRARAVVKAWRPKKKGASSSRKGSRPRNGQTWQGGRLLLQLGPGWFPADGPGQGLQLQSVERTVAQVHPGVQARNPSGGRPPAAGRGRRESGWRAWRSRARCARVAASGPTRGGRGRWQRHRTSSASAQLGDPGLPGTRYHRSRKTRRPRPRSSRAIGSTAA